MFSRTETQQTLKMDQCIFFDFVGVPLVHSGFVDFAHVSIAAKSTTAVIACFHQ